MLLYSEVKLVMGMDQNVLPLTVSSKSDKLEILSSLLDLQSQFCSYVFKWCPVGHCGPRPELTCPPEDSERFVIIRKELRTDFFNYCIIFDSIKVVHWPKELCKEFQVQNKPLCTIAFNIQMRQHFNDSGMRY